MRFLALVLLAFVAAASALFLLAKGDSGVAEDGSGAVVNVPLESSANAAAPATDDAALSPAEIEPPSGEESPTVESGERDASREEAASFAGLDLVDFHGTAMVQPKGERPYTAARGSIEISIINRGQLVPLSIPISGGRFSVEVPQRARIRVEGGRLEGQTVRFLGFEKLFTLNEEQNYAFIGEPIPVNLLRVFEGTQGIPLASVTVRQSVDAHVARHVGEEPVGEIVVEGAASPIELPYLPAQHPIWLHVSAAGYATSAILINPSKTAEHDVTLWPEASLVVRVTGPGRGQLKALLMHRIEPATESTGKPSKRHFATLSRPHPGVAVETDAIVFTIEGVPALPLHLEARGFDARGRETLIGEGTAEVGPGERRTVELRVKAP
ncbi:MAG: hypothetical protein AAGG01_02985 [Planctomycetota bacterium]